MKVICKKLKKLLSSSKRVYDKCSNKLILICFQQSSANESSDWGAPPSPLLLLQIENYQLAAAQVSEYNNEFTVDLRYMTETRTPVTTQRK